METEEKCGLCVDARTVRKRHGLEPCFSLILTLPTGLFLGGVFVGDLLKIVPSVPIPALVVMGSLCILSLVVSYFLLCRLGRAIVGTYLYHFHDSEEVMHCHKHDYGNGEEDKWRRTQGAKDDTYLREAVRGLFKKTAMFRNGEEVESISVKALGASGRFRVDRGNIQLMFLEPRQVLLAEGLIESESQLLFLRLLERQRCVSEANDARRLNALLNEALDAQALRLAFAIDYAIKQKRGGRESQAVAGIRAKLEDMLEELPTEQLMTLFTRIQEDTQGEWDASKERLLGIIQARLNRRAETVDEPLPPLPAAVAERATAP